MLVSETPATTSCRATPSPQSITYAVLFVTITCADAELALRGRGPPPVPRSMSRVGPPCATIGWGPTAAAQAIAVARNPRRVVVDNSQRSYLQWRLKRV